MIIKEKMANVCLIYHRDININFFPLGIGYIASYLVKNNHTVTLLDIAEDDINLLNKLKERKPDIIGISITTPQLKLAGTVIDNLRKIIPDVPIVAGGIHPSYFKEKFLKDYNIEYVVYGEGEITMNELCNSLKTGLKDMSGIDGLIYRDMTGRIMVNHPRELIKDLDTLPFPARDLVNYQTYLQPPGLIRGLWTDRCTNIMTSRGCPGRCTYCGANYLWKNIFRRRTVNNVLEEIDLLVEKYNIDGLHFLDDTFLMNTKWIEELAEKFIEKKYDFKWACFGRVDTVNDKILKAIRRAGCTQVSYGFESCSENVLKRIRKKTDVKQMTDAVKMTKDLDMSVFGSFMFGFPEDTEEDLQKTISISSKMDIDFVTCYFTTPYPASELYEQAISENRIINKDMSNWYLRNHDIWKVDLPENTLMHYRNKFLKANRLKNISFFLKNPVFLCKLLFFMLKNYNALCKAVGKSIKERCFDDFGYYFYTYMSNNTKNRNRI